MKLTRCTAQKTSLETFYNELYESYKGAPLGESALAYLDVIAELRNHPATYEVWGLTSHHRLILLAEDDYESLWYVICEIHSMPRYENWKHHDLVYHVSFELPEVTSPWSRGTILGIASSLEEAVQLIILAMKESKGWEN